MEVSLKTADADLLRELRSGDRIDVAIKTIYRSYFDSLGWYVMNNNGSRQDAEDVFQEVVVSFIDLVQKNKFRGESGIKTFLFALNRHAWLNELKKRGRTLKREEKYNKGQELTETNVSDVMIDREDRMQIINLLEQLGDTCKKILLLFYYDNFSIAEILDNLHYENEQVVRNKKSKCLKQLQQIIREKPELKQTLKNLLNG
ncbi:MAG: sigma-70 family RNA polymerase sigma factor [Chitinophagaceae bacterium]